MESGNGLSLMMHSRAIFISDSMSRINNVSSLSVTAGFAQSAESFFFIGNFFFTTGTGEKKQQGKIKDLTSHL